MVFIQLRDWLDAGVEDFPKLIIPERLLQPWEVFRHEIERCAICSRNADLMSQKWDLCPTGRLAMVEDAPGSLEAQGRYSELVQKMLAAIGLKREEVTLLSLVQGSEEPEAQFCRAHFDHRLNLLKPKAVLVWGSTATGILLGDDIPFSKHREVPGRYSSWPVHVTHHPAALLRDPTLKREAWSDLQSLQRTLMAPPSHGKLKDGVPQEAPS